MRALASEAANLLQCVNGVPTVLLPSLAVFDQGDDAPRRRARRTRARRAALEGRPVAARRAACTSVTMSTP